MLSVLLLSFVVAKPVPSVAPVCSEPVVRAGRLWGSAPVEFAAAIQSCFPREQVANDDDVAVQIHVFPNDAKRHIHLEVLDLEWGDVIHDVTAESHKDAFPELLGKTLRDAVTAIDAWRAATPARQIGEGKRAKALSKVVVVVDSTRALPPPERAALELVLARMRRHGVTIRENADAPAVADETSTEKRLLMTVAIDSKDEKLDKGGTGYATERFGLDVRLKINDGRVVVAQENWQAVVMAINLDKGMQVETDKHATRGRRRSEYDTRGDKLILGIMRHLALPLDVPRPATGPRR